MAGAGWQNGGAGVLAENITPSSNYDLTINGFSVVPGTNTVIPSNYPNIGNLAIAAATVSASWASPKFPE